MIQYLKMLEVMAAFGVCNICWWVLLSLFLKLPDSPGLSHGLLVRGLWGAGIKMRKPPICSSWHGLPQVQVRVQCTRASSWPFHSCCSVRRAWQRALTSQDSSGKELRSQIALTAAPDPQESDASDLFPTPSPLPNFESVS